MDEDQLFLFADEVIDHLNAALDKARQIKEMAKIQVKARGTWQYQRHLGAEEKKKLHALARDMYFNVDDAGTAANAMLGEVQGL